ncbi:unnamed protein product [Schistosoma turkestanicum]|nr:unnamed protein product [Schistosoma turkestanicum]
MNAVRLPVKLIGVKDLIRPPEPTVLSEIITRAKESIYESIRKRPLGCSPIQQHIPAHLDKYKTTFGIKTEKGDKAGDLINPPRKRMDIINEELQNHEHYLISHKHLFPGEQAHRNYKNFDDKKVFGMQTNLNRQGILVRQAMNWILNDNDDVSGKVKDLKHDTIMNVPDGHVFGLPGKSHDITAGQLLHDLLPRKLTGLHNDTNSASNQDELSKKNYVRYSDRFKLMKVVIHHALRKAHYTHGPEIIAVLCQLADKSNLVSMLDARRIYYHFQVPLDEELTEHLFDLITIPASDEMIKHIQQCIKQNEQNDLNDEKHHYIVNDMINWAVDLCKFSELLNWNHDKSMQKCSSNVTTTTITNNNSSSSSDSVIKPECCEDSDLIRKRLQRAIQANIHYWTTTNSTYAGNRNGVINTTDWERLGEKCIQYDKLVPKFRRSTDWVNYGDEAGVGSIINPNIFTDYGLNSRDLLILRNKQDILNIFTEANLSSLFNASLNFDKVWQMAISLDKALLGTKAPTTDDQVTLHSFKDALFKLLHKECYQPENGS